MLIQKPEPVPNKLCSRCNTQKTCEDFYRDASKPDGLQVPLSAYRTPLGPQMLVDLESQSRLPLALSKPFSLINCFARLISVPIQQLLPHLPVGLAQATLPHSVTRRQSSGRFLIKQQRK